MLVNTEPFAGLKTSKFCPEAAGTHLPAIKLRFGCFNQFESFALIVGT